MFFNPNNFFIGVFCLSLSNKLNNMKTFFKLMGFYVSRSGILHTKTLFAVLMANIGVTDGHFIYLGRNMYKLNKEE
jgi:hypothetical protein